MKVRMRVSAPILETGKCRCLFAHVWFFSLVVLGLYSVLGLSAPAQAQNAVVLVGSGSSVPAPLYNRWAQEFVKHNQSIQVRYVPIGTSEGIKQISHGTGDFGAGE